MFQRRKIWLFYGGKIEVVSLQPCWSVKALALGRGSVRGRSNKLHHGGGVKYPRRSWYCGRAAGRKQIPRSRGSSAVMPTSASLNLCVDPGWKDECVGQFDGVGGWNCKQRPRTAPFRSSLCDPGA